MKHHSHLTLRVFQYRVRRTFFAKMRNYVSFGNENSLDENCKDNISIKIEIEVPRGVVLAHA